MAPGAPSQLVFQLLELKLLNSSSKVRVQVESIGDVGISTLLQLLLTRTFLRLVIGSRLRTIDNVGARLPLRRNAGPAQVRWPSRSSPLVRCDTPGRARFADRSIYFRAIF